MDDIETCVDLNLRMQSILVKQHVLEALSMYEEKMKCARDKEKSDEEESSGGESEEESMGFEKEEEEEKQGDK